MISRHIAYLDQFRLWILQKNEHKVQRPELIGVNQKLVAFIDKYLSMLTQWTPGPSEFTNYKEDISTKINQIKTSKFIDTKTHIAARGGEVPF